MAVCKMRKSYGNAEKQNFFHGFHKFPKFYEPFKYLKHLLSIQIFNILFSQQNTPCYGRGKTQDGIDSQAFSFGSIKIYFHATSNLVYG